LGDQGIQQPEQTGGVLQVRGCIARMGDNADRVTPTPSGAALQLITKEDIGKLALGVGQPFLLEALAI
jgi:hypothetical protein